MRGWRLAVAVCTIPVAVAHGMQAPLRWEGLQTGVTVRLRGVSAVSSEVAWVSGAQGTVLRTSDGGKSWQSRPVPEAGTLDFRDIEARDTQTAVVMSAGPGTASRIYRTSDGGASWRLCYTAPEPGMFLDALTFIDADRAVAVSDAVDGRFVVLTTDDAGTTWSRVPAERLPGALPGEGAFAASGTNVAAHGTHVWIGTTRSRVLHSPDGGRTWTIAQTPVPTGEATGIFSIAFRSATHGIVVGGAYNREAEAVDNVATTTDGGTTWHAVRGRGLSGFRSVVTHVPRLGPAAWLALGPSGMDVSEDDGRTWTPSGGDGYDAVSLARDGTALFASGSGGRVARAVLSR